MEIDNSHSPPPKRRNTNEEIIDEEDPFGENYELVKVILLDRDELMMKQRARCDEMGYNWVLVIDTILLII